MPDPNRKESQSEYMSRCMGSEKARSDFPDEKQRYAFCATRWKAKGNKVNNYIEAVEEYSALGYTEELSIENLVIPTEADYEDFGEDTEDIDISEAIDFTKSDSTGACWEGYERVPNTKEGEPGSCRKKGSGAKAAEYQGRKVTLNKPFLTPDGPKKRSVYVKNDKGNVVKVNFGDPNMKIKKSDPERRKSFRARHNCDSPGPKWKARYWSCKMW